MNNRKDLRPFLQKFHWLVPLLGVLCLLVSPILMPILVCLANKSDVKDFYKEIFEAIKYNPMKGESE